MPVAVGLALPLARVSHPCVFPLPVPAHSLLPPHSLNSTISSLIGEVFDYLVAHGRMKEKEARAKFRQVGVSPL